MTGTRMPVAALVAALVGASGCASAVKSDEEVVFFRSAAAVSSDGARWTVPVHGWIFEPEEDSALRRTALAGLQAALGLEDAAVESEVFRRRARWFLVDNERWKTVAARLGEQTLELPVTGANGHAEGAFTVATTGAAAVPAASAPLPWVPFQAALAPGDARSFVGEAQLVPPRGISIISDIDDTVKVSNVQDKRALLAATFTRPFEVVPGMAALYARWAAQGCAVHYVSASPWQLYVPLVEFLDGAGFPRGPLHLKLFRVKDKTFSSLFQSPLEYKVPLISSIMERFPGRTFVLVGDSTEKDPEVYAEVCRRFPGRVLHVCIRAVPPSGDDRARFAAAFKDLPADRWTLFTDPDRLARLVPAAGR